jgi:hypothetical protein
MLRSHPPSYLGALGLWLRSCRPDRWLHTAADRCPPGRAALIVAGDGLAGLPRHGTRVKRDDFQLDPWPGTPGRPSRAPRQRLLPLLGGLRARACIGDQAITPVRSARTTGFAQQEASRWSPAAAETGSAPDQAQSAGSMPGSSPPGGVIADEVTSAEVPPGPCASAARGAATRVLRSRRSCAASRIAASTSGVVPSRAPRGDE